MNLQMPEIDNVTYLRAGYMARYHSDWVTNLTYSG